jgi:hypothetical protein
MTRAQVKISFSGMQYIVALSRVPCVGEVVSFVDYPEGKRTAFRVLICGVEHMDAAIGEGRHDAIVTATQL